MTMIEVLLKLNLTENDILGIKEWIDDSAVHDLEETIQILKQIGCDEDKIKNIIIGNPLILNRSANDIQKLITCLTDYGFQDLNLLFDSYPSMLNKDAFEIEDYIEEKRKNKEELEDIIDRIDSNPAIVDEI